MRREPNIPLFLWVTAAIVAHAVGGGGATKVVEQIEETLDIGSFASQVRFRARFAGDPIEISMLAEESPPEDLEESADERLPSDPSAPDSEEKSEKQTTGDTQVVKPDDLAQLREIEKEKEELAAPDREQAKEKEKPEEKVVDLNLQKERAAPQPVVVPNRRIAVDQHVEDKDQEDNPNARFAGDHANRVEEETRAQITATDQNAEDPSVGKTFAGSHPEPGNAEETRIAQSDESPGPTDSAPGEASDGQEASARAPVEGHNVQATGSASKDGGEKLAAQKAPPSGQSAQEAQAASDAEDAMVETLNARNGSFSIAQARRARAAQEAQRARAARPRLPRQTNNRPDQMLGYGSQGTTARGVNLNLNHQIARSVITERKIAELKKRDGERRLSKHRGSWASVGLDRWRPAIENYVSSVKQGNQTALNTARVPFARYLNQIHQRLHEIFAHGFLGHLDGLPPNHPLNNPEMSTHLEIALSPQDGRIVKMGITKSSGVTAFDVGALESVKKASPYGVPPGSIVSSDGNVYLHWEFHRKPAYACSTYFARPFIINVGQEAAPPQIEPKKRPPSEEQKKPNKRSGSLEKKQPSANGKEPT